MILRDIGMYMNGVCVDQYYWKNIYELELVIFGDKEVRYVFETIFLAELRMNACHRHGDMDRITCW